MVAKSTAAKKAKGRSFCIQIKQAMLEMFPQLEEDDIKVTSSGAGGEDLQFSPAARKLMPISVEAKFQETVQFWAAYEQAKVNSKNKYIPVLFAKRSRTEPIVVLSMTNFLWMLGQMHDNTAK